MANDNKGKANDVFNNKDGEGDSHVICVVCQQPVAKMDKERARVKLICGHRFHLDCIGSSFNAKNKMECPLCRLVEDGQWLFAQPQQQDYSDLAFPPETEDIDTQAVRLSYLDRILSHIERANSVVSNQLSTNADSRNIRWWLNTAALSRLHRSLEEFTTGPLEGTNDEGESSNGESGDGESGDGEVAAGEGGEEAEEAERATRENGGQ